MGCWGITAFESDEGLDAVEFIRESIPEDGKLELETLVETLKRDSWNAPPGGRNGRVPYQCDGAGRTYAKVCGRGCEEPGL